MNLIIAIIITDIQWLQSASKDQVMRDSILRDNIQNHIVIIIVMIQDWDCHDSHDPYCEHIIWQHDFSNLEIVLIWLSLFKMIIMAIFLLSRFSYTRRIMIMIIFFRFSYTRRIMRSQSMLSSHFSDGSSEGRSTAFKIITLPAGSNA